MIYLALIVNDEIIDEIPTTMSDDEAAALDEMLLKHGILKEGVEVATTEDIEDE